MTKNISPAVVNLVTPELKAGAKHEHLFNELPSEAGLLNKFLNVTYMILVKLCCAS